MSCSAPLEAVTQPEPGATGRRTVAARGALWLSLSSWAARITQTVMLLVLARALVPAQFGILAVAALTYKVLMALNHLGVSDALPYFKDRVEEATRTALSTVIVGGSVLLAATSPPSRVTPPFLPAPQPTFA